MPPVSVAFLRDGGQPAAAVARMVADFVEGARATLDIALYDLNLDGDARSVVAAAFAAAGARGVRIRLLYNHVEVRRAEEPPASQVEWELLHSLPGEHRAVEGEPFLFHHKYCVRDGEAVLAGSANWTTDSWSRQENVLVRLESAAVAALYAANFEEVWERPVVEGSGHQPTDWIDLAPDLRLRVHFHPRRAHVLVHRLAECIAGARERIRICSPVLTSGPILGTLAELVDRPAFPSASGVLDATQVAEARNAWLRGGTLTWKLHALDHVLGGIPFSGKHSTPWARGSVHDFMHAKCTVVDGTVFVGSFNLSHSGETNAENVVEVQSRALADMFTGFIDGVAAAYPPLRPRGTDV